MKKFQVRLVRIENRVETHEVYAEDDEAAYEMGNALFEQFDFDNADCVHADEFVFEVSEVCDD